MKQANKKQQKHKKAAKSMNSKTVSSSGKNIMIGVLHQKASTLKVTEALTCKNKYTFF